VARKRAPGGGRKPKGEIRGKSHTLTTRITQETRSGLEREAARSGRSLSQEIEVRLVNSLHMPEHIEKEWGKPHVYALARLISQLVIGIELSTGKSWRQDSFTAHAVRAATDIIVARLIPDGPIEVPERVERSAQSIGRFAPEQSEHIRTPEGVGSSIALGMVNGLELYDYPPLDHPRSHHHSDNFYLMPSLRESLGLPKKDDK
jgi:TraY domain